MSGLDTYHIKVSNTTEDKFQNQLTLIQLMQKNRSIINDTNIKTKTPKNNDWQIINIINSYNLESLECSLSVQ